MSAASVREKVYANGGNHEVIRWVPPTAKYVLDLGCGAGGNASILAAKVGHIDGVTLSEQEAEKARQFCSEVFVHNLEQGVPPGAQASYDVVLASHVLEHICFPEKLLSDAAARLSPEGVLIVALPNLMNFRYRLRLIFGRFEYEDGGIMDNTHFRWYTFASGRRLLESNGFRVVHAYAESHMPLPFIGRLIPAGLRKSITRFAGRILPGLFGVQLIYVAQRK